MSTQTTMEKSVKEHNRDKTHTLKKYLSKENQEIMEPEFSDIRTELSTAGFSSQLNETDHNLVK